MADDCPPLSKQESDRVFFRLICTNDELERALSPKCASDYLLALRAGHIVDNARITRYFLRKKRELGQQYSLANCFETSHYELYIRTLDEKDQVSLRDVTYADVFTTIPDGVIFNSSFGRIVTISYSLNYFLEFGHLALGEFWMEVPVSVRFRALIVALRVMF